MILGVWVCFRLAAFLSRFRGRVSFGSRWQRLCEVLKLNTLFFLAFAFLYEMDFSGVLCMIIALCMYLSVGESGWEWAYGGGLAFFSPFIRDFAFAIGTCWYLSFFFFLLFALVGWRPVEQASMQVQ